MRRIVYFLAKSIYCSKQHTGANAHVDPYLCCQPNPTAGFSISLFVLHAKRNIIDDANNNNYNYSLLLLLLFNST